MDTCLWVAPRPVNGMTYKHNVFYTIKDKYNLWNEPKADIIKKSFIIRYNLSRVYHKILKRIVYLTRNLFMFDKQKLIIYFHWWLKFDDVFLWNVFINFILEMITFDTSIQNVNKLSNWMECMILMTPSKCSHFISYLSKNWCYV